MFFLSNGKKKVEFISLVNYYLVLVGITFLFTIYYYGIQLTFSPDGEGVGSVIVAYDTFINGEQIEFRYMLLRLICYLVVPFLGLSYKSLRIAYCILYFFYVIFSLDIVIRDNSGKKHWERLPIYIIFMVLLPIQITEYWGELGNGWVQYPFNQHVEVMIASIIGIWIIYRLSGSRGIKQKVFWGLLILWNMLSFYMTNQIWIICFFIPELLWIFVKLDKKLIWIESGLLGLVVLRILAIKISSIKVFFSLKGEQDYFFKTTDWTQVENILGHISNYFQAIISMFGCDFSQLNVYNLSFFVYVLKLLCVLYMFIIAIRNMKARDNNILEFIISWGGFLLSFFWICTFYASSISHHIRYLIVLIPYGTILLCLHYQDYKVIEGMKIIDKKSQLFIFSMIILFMFPYEQWGREKSDKYDQEYISVIETVKKEKLHCGIWGQSYALGTQVYVLSGGECSLIRGNFKDNGMRLTLSEEPESICDYIVFEKNDNEGVMTNLYELNVVYAASNGEPDEIVELCDGEVLIYIYRDGVNYDIE